MTGMPQEEEGGQGELSALRSELRDDYGAEPETPKGEGHSSLLGRLRRWWRRMGPVWRTMVVGALVIVCLAVVGGGSLVATSIFAQPTPVPPATPTFSAVPYPISLSLPSGLIFTLTPESNNSTMVDQPLCRVVSLPWTIQLESTLRKLKANDVLKVSMSNYDSITYKFQSIEQVPSSEVDKLAENNGPCLLVVLSREETDTEWVLTAKP
jgi:hypothetical protein